MSTLQKIEPRPVVLEGNLVRLEPLTMNHAEQLAEVGMDDDIWRYLSAVPTPRSLADVEAWIGMALRAAEKVGEVPFAIIHKPTGKAIGSTRYLDVRPIDRGLEIGWTWLARAHMRTGVNTECKYLLLRHAFEDLGALRVQLKTDKRNIRSQNAIARIGGVYEGILRKHIVCHDGYHRDCVFYGFINTEWPATKARLEEMIRAGTAKQSLS